MILGPIGDDSIRMPQIPKLGDGINCVFQVDKRVKLAPMCPQNNNKTTGHFSTATSTSDRWQFHQKVTDFEIRQLCLQLNGSRG